MSGYKNKTVKKHLRKKIEGWLSHIPYTGKEVLICGGAVNSLLLGETPNDYDIYFKDYDHCKSIMSHYFPHHPKNEVAEGVQFIGRPLIGRYAKGVKFVSENAISLDNSIQLISRFVGNPREIFSNYDFIHTNMAYDYDEDRLVLDAVALQALLSKTLIYNGSRYPLASILRIRKFLDRGWSISVGQILKIVLQRNKLDLSDPVVLKEQLLGVDSEYATELIEKLCNLTPGEIHSEVLDELIDDVFDEILRLNILK